MSTLSFEGEVARNNQLSEDNCIALVGIFEIYTIAPGGPITTERYAKNPSLVDLSNNPAPGEFWTGLRVNTYKHSVVVILSL